MKHYNSYKIIAANRMHFKLLPVIDLMLGLYRQPLSPARFHDYLKLLEGNTKGKMVLPISGFNPMAKDHVLKKLLELKALNAEQLIENTLTEINKELSGHKTTGIVSVTLNLSDDVGGGWTNRYTSDYDNTFRINALASRHFCTPVFWAGEEYSAELIKKRTSQAVFRTSYQAENKKPVTLKQHVEQEKFVALKSESNDSLSEDIAEALHTFYKEHEHSMDYALIFAFFYGDNACKSLEFPLYGITEDFGGFKYSGSF